MTLKVIKLRSMEIINLFLFEICKSMGVTINAPEGTVSDFDFYRAVF